MEFAGKTAVITGGASGIGFALAKQMGKAGARIILFEPREEMLDEAVEALKAQGIDAKYFAGDVADAAAVEALADFAWAENGRGDIIVNNAGLGGPRGGIFDTDLAEARALYDVNFWGVWNGIQTFGKRYRADGMPAAIYATASENALFNALPTGGGAYVSGKHALFGLMDVLRREIANKPELANIEAGVIIPGWVATALSRNMGMEADRFAEMIFQQMHAGEYYLVAHAYNVVRLRERIDELEAAFARYAPRYDGDEEFDVQLYYARLAAEQAGG
ncbi:MAG TPA: SDR family NAD(P)-dependent oxidoreductase [Sphingorhabdus sp.]|jgi:NAD(P)-dependent dehydrogenase (short-subunit alcohol dehydrogenase family)|uniref:SDR family NAD(P)-dependent oxidoreductase n=1 Tax=Sphingorhabdus sp. TaxID=1902408 RepID=UPI002C33DA24|nr:SDR family NAD(P)-dependent oxidoreductase [Sphingorhabdus sp.]HMT42622.1 SDR family NAD(P)-dependent oxidoreductase [Sphingorhabdus sp.]HMU23322.1 SDR family NAD(P)-dependent oxidoreductase [Sphingorhabdus sp.]